MQLGQRESEATALHLALQYRSVHPTHVITNWKGMGMLRRWLLYTEKGRALSGKHFLPPQNLIYGILCSPRALKEFAHSQEWGWEKKQGMQGQVGMSAAPQGGAGCSRALRISGPQ